MTRWTGRTHRHARRPGALPIALWPLAVGALALIAVPVAGLVARTPWDEAAGDLTSGAVLTPLRLSLVCAAAATALSVVLGLPLAWVLARSRLPARRLVRAVVVLPVVMPPVVGGVALLAVFGRRGPGGRLLERWFDVTLPFTTAGAVLAETFVALPFFVLAAEAGLRGVDRRLEEAAAGLGAGRWRVLRRVTLPLVAPSVAAGAVLAFARALGEFGATITFAGNLPGATQTVPLAVYVRMQQDSDTAVTLAMVLLAVSLTILVALRDRLSGGLRPRA